jgi:AraC family transcriptional regulator
MSSAPETIGWQPRAYLWEGGWIAISRATTVFPVHAHHVVQIILSLDVPVRIHAGDEQWRTCRGAIVLPDAPHSLDPCGALVVFLYVDPECREGRWLRRSLREPITEVATEQFEANLPRLQLFWERPLDSREMAELVLSVVRSLCVGPPPVKKMDPRVTQVLELIRNSDASRIPLEEVAAKVFLSPSRFAHLFAEEVGLPFRRYVLWRKLTRAMQLISRGSSLSSAAHTSGFSDSAHLTRTFHQMFGMNPKALLGRGELYEIPAPFDLPDSGAPAST